MTDSGQLRAVDFFCSGGGMSYGLHQGGIKILGGIDINPKCKDTYEANIPGSQYVCADIYTLKTEELSAFFPVERCDDNLIFAGCSPCQYWSVIRTSKEKSEKSKSLLQEFERFVGFYLPGYVLVENVPGILRRSDESGFDGFLESLQEWGYLTKYEVVNMNDYGVPQSRKRLSLVATRVSKKAVFPRKCEYHPVLRDAIKNMPVIRAGHIDKTPFFHTCSALTEKNRERLKATRKNGGSWSDWANVEGLERDKYSGKGFPDNYGRMSWDKPAPTITTKFFSISNGRFGHPTQTRAISIREGARIQTFPDSFEFKVSSISQAAQIIGNAVPPAFAKRLADAIVESRGR